MSILENLYIGPDIIFLHFIYICSIALYNFDWRIYKKLAMCNDI